jgi:hypothetical protein
MYYAYIPITILSIGIKDRDGRNILVLILDSKITGNKEDD